MSVLAPETIDLTALPFIPLEQRALLPNIPAIYFVLGTDNHVLYIGRAAFLRQRWHKHHRLEEFLLMAHITIAWFAVANRQSLPTLEHLCITQFNPSCNAILPLCQGHLSVDILLNLKLLRLAVVYVSAVNRWG